MRAERLDSSVSIDTPRYLCSPIGDETFVGYHDTEALGVVHPSVSEPYPLAFMRWVVAGGVRIPIGVPIFGEPGSGRGVLLDREGFIVGRVR